MRANPLDDVLQDLKYAGRSLSKSPTFTLVAVLSLALGIGATTTVFSLVDSLLLRPLPVPHPERLVTLEQVSTDGVRQYNLSYDDAERFGELTGNAWSALAATSWADAYDGSGEAAGDWRRAETLRVSLVTGEYFQVLGVRPRAGRALDRPGRHRGGDACRLHRGSLLGQAVRPIRRRDRPRHPAERHALHRRRHRAR